MAWSRAVPIMGGVLLAAACTATPEPAPTSSSMAEHAATPPAATAASVDCLARLQAASRATASQAPISGLAVLRLGPAEGAAFLLEGATASGEAAAQPADCTLLLAAPSAFTLATRSLGQETTSGEYRVRTVRRLNPDYLEARRAVEAAQEEDGGSSGRIAASGDPTLDLIGLAIAGISKGAEILIGQQQLANAQDVLEDTPKFVEESEFAPYRLHLREVELLKSGEIQAALVDRRRGLVRVAALPVEDRTVHTVAANLHEEDRRRREGGATYLAPPELEALTAAPARIDRSTLLAAAYRALATVEPRPGALAGTSEALVAAARSTRPASVAATSAAPVALAEGPGIVRVGGLAERGLGVYVRPDLVLTSRSLLGASTMVEVEGPQGQATYGIVEAADDRSDLALVYVQREGRPMPLADGPPAMAVTGFAWDTPWGTPLAMDGRLIGLVLAPAAGGTADLATIRDFLAAHPMRGRSAGPSRAAASLE